MSARRRGHKKKVVLVAGVFDMLHLGHIAHLRQAHAYGDVIAVIARDTTVARVKGHRPFFPEKERMEMVSAIKYVQKAILGDLEDPYKSVARVKPDVICLGYDQKIFIPGLHRYLVQSRMKVRIVKTRKRNPKKFKSSAIKASR